MNTIIAIETAQHKYLKSYSDGRITIDQHATMFRIRKVGTLEVALWNAYHKYITLDKHGKFSVSVDLKWAERFRIVFLDELHVAFILSNERYLSADVPKGLVATSRSIGSLEVFTIHIH